MTTALAYADEADLNRLVNSYLARAKNAPVAFEQVKGSMRRFASTEAKRQVSAIYNLTQERVVKHGLDVRKSDAGVIVAGDDEPVSFNAYGWKEAKRGARGRIIRAKSAETIPGSFVAIGNSNNQHVFKRKNEPPLKMTRGRYIGKKRTPLRAFFGPSIGDALEDTRVSNPLREKILGRAGKELRRRLTRLGGQR